MAEPPPPGAANGMLATAPAASRADTKQKLASIIDGFSSFDSEMKIGTRQRREKDEQRIAELKTDIIKIDKALSAEIKRGLERNKAIQTWADEQLVEINTNFTSRLEERTKDASERLEVLRARIDSVEEYFAREKERILTEVEERGAELSKLLHEFQETFEAERKERLEREGRILKQLGEHEQEVALRFDQERTSRENKYADIRRTLEEFIRTRTKSDEKFQTFVYEELQHIKNDVARETQTRMREDDEIVDALNRYTSKLQQSLKIINSTEM